MNQLTWDRLPGKEAIDLYRRTYITVLRSSGEIRVHAFVTAHREMQSSLHGGANDDAPDTGALIYAANRLPLCMHAVERIWLGQMPDQFAQATGIAVDAWRRVQAAARRRDWHFDGAGILAVFIASPSDLDDMIPTLVAYQIEWNKLHELLERHEALREVMRAAPSPSPELLHNVMEALGVPEEDWLRLLLAWGDTAWVTLQQIARGPKDLRIRLIGGSHVAYATLLRRWSEPIVQLLAAERLDRRPVYFVSSNMHGLANLLSGYALGRATMLEEFLRTTDDVEAAELRAAWHWSNRENLLYYAARLWARCDSNVERRIRERAEEEQASGIWTLPAQTGFDVDAQIIELRRLRVEHIDPRLADVGSTLTASDAVIINIDYPLGLAAYRLLRELAEVLPRLRGVYIVGKAATLNGGVGDILVSDVVFDAHSSNTYSFPNAFRYADLAPYLARGSVLDNQKAVTVRGTFLQNRDFLEVFYREQYTVVEMEAGPYLSAVYEATYPTRHPVEEPVHFRGLPFDLGIVHYASDTPYTRARTLGGRSLSFEGIDATYAAMIAVMRRIAAVEAARPRGDG